MKALILVLFCLLLTACGTVWSGDSTYCDVKIASLVPRCKLIAITAAGGFKLYDPHPNGLPSLTKAAVPVANCADLGDGTYAVDYATGEHCEFTITAGVLGTATITP